MKALVIGAGKIGRVLIKDLLRYENSEVSEVIVGDRDPNALQTLARFDRLGKLRTHLLDVSDVHEIASLARHSDVVMSAVFGDFNPTIAKAAISSGCCMVDVGWDSPKIFELDTAAKDAGVTIIPSCGLDPGIDKILQGSAASRLDVVDGIYSWCGGIPQKGTPGYQNPLKYKISWDWNGTIDLTLGATTVLIDGKKVNVSKVSGPIEKIVFPEPIGECEAFFTDAPFDVIEALNLKQVKNAWSKTVRWPGHAEMWKKLIDLHLLDDNISFRFAGTDVSPREFFTQLGNKTLQYSQGEGDLVVMRVIVTGKKNEKMVRHTFEMIDLYDSDSDERAMSRTTAFPCSIVGKMITEGLIREKGVVPTAKIGADPHIFETFVSRLRSKNIRIAENFETLEK